MARLVQVAQGATDLDRSARWYADLLGVEPAARFDPPGLVFFVLDGMRLLLDAGAPGALVYLAVDDVDATVSRLRTAGTEVAGEPHVIFGHDDDTLGPAGTDEWMAFVKDPDGHLVGLVEQRPRATHQQAALCKGVNLSIHTAQGRGDERTATQRFGVAH